MRINAYLARLTGLSRRKADELISAGHVSINNDLARPGIKVSGQETITIDGRPVTGKLEQLLIALNKPEGYVVSRNGQGSSTIYDLLPQNLHSLKPIGRLDKDSSGLLLLTNDGQLANDLTHPSKQKTKKYEVDLNRPLDQIDLSKLNQGIKLFDGISHLTLSFRSQDRRQVKVVMSEGRNRQIRRSFESLDYQVIRLNRLQIANFSLGQLKSGQWKQLKIKTNE